MRRIHWTFVVQAAMGFSIGFFAIGVTICVFRAILVESFAYTAAAVVGLGGPFLSWRLSEELALRVRAFLLALMLCFEALGCFGTIAVLKGLDLSESEFAWPGLIVGALLVAASLYAGKKLIRQTGA